jgi:hypothetical protein
MKLHKYDSSLLGIPGGGKTHCITEAIKRIPHKALVLTFSRAACETIQRRCNACAKTIHSLSSTINSKYGNGVDLSIQPVQAIINMKRTTSSEFINKIPLLRYINYILVDEAQDLSDVQYEFCSTLKKLLDVPLTMVGDPNQSIYQFQGGNDRYLTEHASPDNEVVLVKNYRSTQQIVEFCNEFRPWRDRYPPMTSATGRQGPKPYIYRTDKSGKSGFLDVIQHVCTTIKNEIPPEEYHKTVILSPVKKTSAKFDMYTQLGLTMFTRDSEIPQLMGLKFKSQYNLFSSSNDYSPSKDVEYEPGKINLITCHGSKGMEFEHVFLLNFNDRAMGWPLTKTLYDRYQYLFYVAITRAKYSLRIYINHFTVNDKSPNSPFYILKNVDRSLYQMNDYMQLKFDELFVHDIVDRQIDMQYSVTSLVNPSFDIMTTNSLYMLHRKIPTTRFASKVDPIPYVNSRDVQDNYDNAPLHGRVAEQLFSYLFHCRRGLFSDYIKLFKKQFQKFIVVTNNEVKDASKQLANLKRIINDIDTIQVSSDLLRDVKESVDEMSKTEERNCLELYNYLVKYVEDTKIKNFCVTTYLTYYTTAKNEAFEILDNQLRAEKDVQDNDMYHYIKYITKLCAILYRIDIQVSDAFTDDELSHIVDHMLESIFAISYTVDIISQRYEKLTFSVYKEHAFCNVRGEIDVLGDDKDVIELKYTKQIKSNHIYQALWYHTMNKPRWWREVDSAGKIVKTSSLPVITLINLRQGAIQKYSIKSRTEEVGVYDIEQHRTTIENVTPAHSGIQFIQTYSELMNNKAPALVIKGDVEIIGHNGIYREVYTCSPVYKLPKKCKLYLWDAPDSNESKYDVKYIIEMIQSVHNVSNSSNIRDCAQRLKVDYCNVTTITLCRIMRKCLYELGVAKER